MNIHLRQGAMPHGLLVNRDIPTYQQPDSGNTPPIIRSHQQFIFPLITVRSGDDRTPFTTTIDSTPVVAGCFGLGGYCSMYGVGGVGEFEGKILAGNW
ncbi:MAG: hypothetical protein IT447_04325 [Phycisphaerales bacterium]|nr:hypothetical protein [Phycisphaerales bacterium]